MTRPLLALVLFFSPGMVPVTAQSSLGCFGGPSGPGTIGVPLVSNMVLSSLSYGASGCLGPSCCPLFIRTGGDVLNIHVDASPLSSVCLLIGATCHRECFAVNGPPAFSVDVGNPVTLLCLCTAFPGLGLPVDGSGNLDLPVSLMWPADGPVLCVQGLVFSGALPGGVTTTQAWCVEARTWCPGGTLLPLGDDDAALVPLPTPITFYGVTYSDVYVGSNGNLSFGAPDTDPSPTVAEFLTNAPRIATHWSDWDPTVAPGQVVTSPSASTLCVAWTGLDHVAGLLTPDSSTVCVELNGSSGTLQFSLGIVAGSGTTVGDMLIGISPGNSLSLDPGTSDLSGLPLTGLPFTTLYEWFPTAAPFDLNGVTLSFVPGPMGEYLVL